MAFEITDPISATITAVGNIIDRFVPDKAAAQAAKDALAQSAESGELQVQLAQIGVNQQEAKSNNWFIAGARPFILWVCALSMAYDIVIYPVAIAYFPTIHPVDTTLLMPILASLIGLRSWEKGKGVDAK